MRQLRYEIDQAEQGADSSELEYSSSAIFSTGDEARKNV
jgi:hypothetical protein